MTIPYSRGARLFHWLVVVLLAIQIPAGIAMISTGFQQPTIDKIFILHKGLGSILLAVILLRVVWRVLHPAPAMDESISPAERRIAGRVHATLYALLVIMPVSGYLRVVGDGYPIELLNWLGVPPLIPKMEGVALVASLVHRFAVFALVALFSVHVAEVLRHHFVLRDKPLARIWPL